MRRILCIDDDIDNLHLLSELLSEQFDVAIANCGLEGIRLAHQEVPHAICLDLHMSDMDGFETCQRLKSNPKTCKIPIMIVSVESGIQKRVQALDIGADDYLQRPFYRSELVARLKSLIRRDAVFGAESVTVLGKISLDLKRMEVRIGDDKCELTPKLFEILHYFCQRPDRIVSRSDLIRDLWPEASVCDRVIDAHLTRIRKRLQALHSDFNFESVHGIGYKFLANPRKRGANASLTAEAG